MAQWLRFRAPNAGALGSIPAQGTRCHVPQLRLDSEDLRHSEDAAAEPWYSQMKEYFLKNKSLNDTNQKMQILTYRSCVCVYIYVLCVFVYMCVYIYIHIYIC